MEPKNEPYTWSQEWRHICEVRTLARWHREHGRDWTRDHIRGVASQRGKPAARRLLDDLNAELDRQREPAA